jgi:di/tricarboxylate transporter
MLFIICFFTVGITELTSNSATASMLLPILAGASLSLSLYTHALPHRRTDSRTTLD